MKAKRTGSLMGVVMGAVCGLAGVITGVYVSIIKPLQENPDRNLPFSLVATSSILILIFAIFIFITAGRYIFKRKSKPSEWGD